MTRFVAFLLVSCFTRLGQAQTPQLFLHLSLCNRSDPFQVWEGTALKELGKPSHLSNKGSGLCMAAPAKTGTSVMPYGDAVGVSKSACEDAGDVFKATGQGQVVSAMSGLCLDADHGFGFYFQLWACHSKNSSDYAHQTFLFHNVTGSIESVSSPGLCVTAGMMKLPRLAINPHGIVSVGASSGGDMAIQLHVAFSGNISGVCGHDAQPYHCAATRFPEDNLVPQTPESSTPHCMGCPPNKTLIYDHCKNHPEWVDVGMLPDYPRRIAGPTGQWGVIDDVKNIYDSSIYLSRAECNTYVGGAEVNSVAMYAMMVGTPDTQIFYRDSCSPQGAGKDTDEECIQHVFGEGSKVARKTSSKLKAPASHGKPENVNAFQQAPFLDDFNVGFHELGFVYVPDMCKDGSATRVIGGCKLMVKFHGCGGTSPMQPGDLDVRYAESNGIVLLRPNIPKYNNASKTYTSAPEIARGCWDGYGQLTEDYALQSAPHMRSVWRMITHLAGLHSSDVDSAVPHPTFLV